MEFRVPKELIYQPIWLHDVDGTLCDAEALWKALYSQYYRLKEQNAPEALVKTFADASTHAQKIYELLQEKLPWFQTEPPEAPPTPPPPGQFPWAEPRR
jgi:hypothetical protein